jgi:DNA repair exonuclease SbcCD ATPase subunit
MLKIKTLTVKNFMSVGNATQAVHLDRSELTLVLGENLDLGGDDSGARNGTGKTTIINALSYALYGQALTQIKLQNLINKTNDKNMMVTVEFDCDGRSYRIERGRKPNFLRLYVDGEEQGYEDDSQGDSRETQKDIERLLSMSSDMFRQVVALNTYSEPFLALRANDQRQIIEQLLGITMLSDKADALKDQIKGTKEATQQEEFRIKAVQEANARIAEQIDNLRKRQRLWNAKRDEDLLNLEKGIRDLADIDIDAEIAEHKKLQDWHDRRKKVEDANRWLRSIADSQRKEDTRQEKLRREIAALKDHKCYACGSELHDAGQERILTEKQAQLKESSLQSLANQTQQFEHEDTIKSVGELGTPPKPFYDTMDEALAHRSTMEALAQQLITRQDDVDPYVEQIADMESKALQEVSWDKINDLTSLREHQEFLLKLLTNKDSFVRKRIIDQNLAYLNLRLGGYLQAIGLPHEVRFLNDLSVEITELGRDLDFDNLSRGERNRLILSLSWAFRDVWESLYRPVNLLFIDELIDSGMDASGVESSIAVLKKMSRERGKSIFLVSHRDELIGRVSSVLTVTKENGFTSYGTDTEMR